MNVLVLGLSSENRECRGIGRDHPIQQIGVFTVFVDPVSRDSVMDIEDVLTDIEAAAGCLPNSYLAWAHNPSVLRAYCGVERTGLWSGNLDQRLRHLVALVACAGGGAAYRLAQVGLDLDRMGFEAGPIREVLQNLDGTLAINDRTRSALQFARDMVSTPNRVTPRSFELLRSQYTEAEIVEIAFVVALMELVRRFDGMSGIRLEPKPMEWADRELIELGWSPGPHDPGRPSVRLLISPSTSAAMPGDGHRLAPLRVEELPELAEDFAQYSNAFVPNSLLVMGRRPDLVRVMLEFGRQVKQTRSVGSDLAYMASWMASYAAGCQYCQAHTSLHANNSGVDALKIEKIWEFESSSLFDEAERVALRLALAGASQPSAMTLGLAHELRGSFSDRQTVDLMIAIASIGFYNRWNDTFATPLESAPFEFASDHLADGGWDGLRHTSPTT